MGKTIFVLIMIFALSLVVAEAQMIGNGNGQGNGQEVAEQTQEIVQSQVRGLENAMLRVRNQEQQQHLEQVMVMIQEQTRERLQKYNGVIFEEDEKGEVIVEASKEAHLFGFIPIQKQYRYQVSEEGEFQNLGQFEWAFRHKEDIIKG